MTDPVAQMLTEIKNAQAVRKQTVEFPFSKLNYAIGSLLVAKGYLRQVEKVGKSPKLRIRLTLHYPGGLPAIEGFQRVSRPSRQVYVGLKDIPYVKQGLGTAVLSTPEGILTDEQARKKRVGGELLFTVW